MFCNNDVGKPDKELLADIQGNIVRGFRRLRAAHVFFRFKAPAEQIRAWLSSHFLEQGAELSVTSAAAQERASPDALLVNLFLTADGLRYLRCDISRMDRAFRRGSRAEETVRLLNDPNPDQWPLEFQQPWHGMVLIAGNDEALLGRQVARLRSAACIAAHVEPGHALDANGQPLKDVDGHRHEHFGFRDGISQPIFLTAHWDQIVPLLGSPNPPPQRDPRRPLSVVLAADPLAGDAKALGSYFVFRRLFQDVSAFHERVSKYVGVLKRRGRFLAELWMTKGGGKPGYEIFRDGMPSDEEIQEYITHRLMGRFRDGRPSPSMSPASLSDAALNDFDFDHDPSGNVCPFSAHVRKMNPRGQTGDLESEHRRTIARRSFPYGTRDPKGTRYKEDCGLLFLCAQSSIADQFEFIQGSWGNVSRIDFNARPTPSIDSLIGQRPAAKELAEYGEDRHRKISETIDVTLDFYDLVEFRGGEYLFAPSLSGLNSLASRREGRPA